MRRKFFAGLWLVVCLVALESNIIAQVDQHRSEIGGHFTSISLTDFQARAFPTNNFSSDSQVAAALPRQRSQAATE